MHIFFFLVIKKKNPYLTQKENKNKNKGQNIHVQLEEYQRYLELRGLNCKEIVLVYTINKCSQTNIISWGPPFLLLLSFLSPTLLIFFLFLRTLPERLSHLTFHSDSFFPSWGFAIPLFYANPPYYMDMLGAASSKWLRFLRAPYV